MNSNNKGNFLINFLSVFIKIVNDTWVFICIKDKYSITEMILLYILLALTTAIYLCFIISYNHQKKEINDKSLQNTEITLFYRNIIEESLSSNYDEQSKILMEDIKNALNNKNWDYVIEIGKHCARLFLMLAKYDLRKYFGECIVEAASQKNDRESEAMGYIDCIGWSLVKMGDYDGAKENIDKGISLISTIQTKNANILKCKGYRHLHSIALKRGIKTDAKNMRDLYEKNLKKIWGKDKKIMVASLYIIDGDIYANESNNEDAKKQYMKALKLFEKYGDNERLTKVYYKLGYTNEKMNQYPKALKNYLIGFALSNKFRRIDEKIKNCEGICSLLKKDESLLNNVSMDVDIKGMDKNELYISKDCKFYFNELEKLQHKIHV